MLTDLGLFLRQSFPYMLLVAVLGGGGAAAWGATCFCHVFYHRRGLRAVLLGMIGAALNSAVVLGCLSLWQTRPPPGLNSAKEDWIVGSLMGAVGVAIGAYLMFCGVRNIVRVPDKRRGSAHSHP
jgi:hypothetical protein